MDTSLKDKFFRIRLLAMDFDGVHTDGQVWTDEQGKESVMSSRLDGMGLEMLQRLTDVKVFVISKEINPVVAMRCKKLKIPCTQGVDKGEGKLEILQRIMGENECASDEVIYMGDDINDIPCLEFVGLGIAVANARQQTKAVAAHVTVATGGNGAIREVCDMILEAKGIEIKL